MSSLKLNSCSIDKPLLMPQPLRKHRVYDAGEEPGDRRDEQGPVQICPVVNTERK